VPPTDRDWWNCVDLDALFNSIFLSTATLPTIIYVPLLVKYRQALFRGSVFAQVIFVIVVTAIVISL
jgi:hypothetical protein